MTKRTVIPLSEPRELRERILDATGEVIARRGPARLSLAQIASQAEVEEALITRVFGGFTHLLDAFAMSDRFWPSVDELAGGDVQGLQQRSLGEQMSAFFKNYLRALRDRPWTLAVMAEEEQEDGGLLVHALVYTRERRALEFFEEVMGDDPPEEVDLPAIILLMALAVSRTGILSTRLKSIGGVDLHSDKGWERIEQTIDLLLTRAFVAAPKE